MALYFDREEYRRKPGTRSNTKLRVSGGDGPATQYITDKDLPTLFEFPYGGAGQKDIVISKGMAVAVKTTQDRDYETNAMRSVLTIAGKAGAGNVVGIVPYNISRRVDGQLTGNTPTLWTRDFIELPLLRSADDAALVKWGAAFSTTGQEIGDGDYLVATAEARNLGKLVKYVKGTHDPADIIGQVLESERDQTPFGWLEWVMFDEQAAKEDVEGLAHKQHATPGPDGREFGTVGFDREGYMNGKYAAPEGYLNPFMTGGGAGIPGITDGANKALTIWTKSQVVPAGTSKAAPVVVRLDYKNILDNSVTVKLDGVDLTTFDVIAEKGMVYVTIPADAVADQTIAVTYRAKFAGTPAGLDYVGAMGALKILLKR